MGTNADKHARQKERRSRVDEARRQIERKSRRNRQMAIAGAVLAILVVIGVLVVLTRSDDSADPDTNADVSSTTTATEAADLPAPPAGITLSAETECPPPGGSDERVQKFAGPPPKCIDPAATYTATFATTEGEFTATLDSQTAPIAVNNFVVLSRYHFYDGVPFHRIVPGFVIQAGDGDGAPWGNNDLGYEFEDELPTDSSAYTDHSLAMANAGPGTNGSQFFVVLPGGGAQLQPNYTKFGQVTQGTDVVDAIGALGTATQEPSKAVLIESVTITETPAG